VRARIAAACRAVGRGSDEVTLIAVTKTRPVSDIRLLAELGVRDIGENKDQEAAQKAAASAALGLDLTWHFVGQLQTNKAASVVSYAQVIHSVDRLRLVGALGSRARAADRTVTCLVQVSLDGDPARGGAVGGQVGALGSRARAADRTVTCLVQVSLDGDPARGGAVGGQVAAVADAVAAEDGLVLGGVMAVAPLGMPADVAFGNLRGVAEDVRSAHPGAVMISAGMSDDLEPAIEAGATHVRVGTALLGGRRAFVR